MTAVSDLKEVKSDDVMQLQKWKRPSLAWVVWERAGWAETGTTRRSWWRSRWSEYLGEAIQGDSSGIQKALRQGHAWLVQGTKWALLRRVTLQGLRSWRYARTRSVGTSEAERSKWNCIPLAVGSHWRSWSGANHDLIYMLQWHLRRTNRREVKKEAREASSRGRCSGAGERWRAWMERSEWMHEICRRWSQN